MSRSYMIILLHPPLLFKTQSLFPLNVKLHQQKQLIKSASLRVPGFWPHLEESLNCPEPERNASLFHKMKVRLGMKMSENGSSCPSQQLVAICQMVKCRHLNPGSSVRAFHSSSYHSMPPRCRGQTGVASNHPSTFACLTCSDWRSPYRRRSVLSDHRRQPKPPWLLND